MKLKVRAKYIRRTGRKRNRRRVRKTVRRNPLNRIQVMPSRIGRQNRRPELKFVTYTANRLQVPYYDASPGDQTYQWALIDIANPNRFLMTQGPGRDQFIGRTINLIDMEVSFRIHINAKRNNAGTNSIFPIGDDENLNYNFGLNGAQTNQNPTVRMVVCWDKQDKQDLPGGPGNSNRNASNLGFQSPIDINAYKIVSDKMYNLRTCFGTNGSLACTNPKTVIYVKQRYPIRMTADMEPEVDNNFRVSIPKNIYLVFSSNADWGKTLDAVNEKIVNISDIMVRLWFRDP